MKKKQKIILVIVSSILFTVVLVFFGIMGTDGTVKYISTPRELQAFAQEVNAGNSYKNKHVILTNDLDMSEIENFTPIGEWGGENFFSGIFDGNGYTIRNLKIVGTGERTNVGLFGVLDGIICNLTIENCFIKGSACGAFCSISTDGDAAILNCAVRDYHIDAVFTDVIGGQYLGIAENCVIDGQGNAEELNHNLKNIWRMIGTVPANLWIEGEDGLVLSKEKGDFPTCVYLIIEDLYEGEIFSVYSEEEDCDVFCLPCLPEEKSATIVVEFADGTWLSETISLPEVKEFNFEKSGEIYNIRFCENENTATIFLDTGVEGGFEYLREEKENMLPGIIQVLDETGEVRYIGKAERISGRGNDSWLQPKQGFALKLEESDNILEMGSAKDYVLLPGYRNASLLTYQVVWDLSKEIEWEHTLDYEMVQLYVDGEYWGLYFLTEKMEIGPDRIDIKESGEVSGGFVFEYAMFDYDDNDVRIVTEQENSYIISSPEEISEEQQAYCLDLWNEFEAALYSESGYNEFGKHYTEYIDLKSWAAQWLFYEINGEFSLSNSIYYYKDADGTGSGKIHALFPWDVEHSYLLMNEDDTERLSAEKDKLWRKLGAHKEFTEEVRRQWKNRFRPALQKMLVEEIVANTDGIGSLEYYTKQFETASNLNELRWGTEHDISQKADSIRMWMELTIPYLDEMLYQDDFFER